MEELKLRIKKLGSAVVVAYSGNFDYDMDNLNEELVENILTNQSKVLVLDMKNVRKVASSFINRLVKILRTAENEKGKLFLVNVPEPVLKILSMVNIIGRFTIYQSEDELRSVYGDSAPDAAEEESRKTPVLKIYKALEGYHHVFTLQGSFVEGANTGLLIEDVKCSLNQGARSITLDFEKTDVMDTISVGLLLSLHKMCEEKRVSIKIANPNDIIIHVLNMNDVGKLFGV
jgi:anti-anti-sigma factor